MIKGTTFLKLVVLLVLIVLVYLSFFYERPIDPDTIPVNQTELVNSNGNKTLGETTDCEMDLDCFSNAITNGCLTASFILPDPLNDTTFLDGEIKGGVLGKCEVFLTDGNKSMTCYLDENSLKNVNSLDALKKTCTGDLLETF